jgi:DNA-binding XRE family transcriptional regulator
MTRSEIVQKIVTPMGETLVVLPLEEYEALVDAADVAAAERTRADIEAGRDELIPEAMVDRMLKGESLVRIWREHRGLTAAQLAAAAEVSAGYLSELETGKKTGSLETLRRIADALKLTVDDLL